MAFLNETGLKTFLNNCDKRYLKLTGGTITGAVTHNSVIYVNCSTGDTGMFATRTDTNKRAGFIVGSGGTNRGIYDNTAGHWLVYSDKDNNGYLSGTATTATTISSTLPVSKGGTGTTTWKAARENLGTYASTSAPSNQATSWAGTIWVQY